jgi:hypothetical protein
MNLARLNVGFGLPPAARSTNVSNWTGSACGLIGELLGFADSANLVEATQPVPPPYQKPLQVVVSKWTRGMRHLLFGHSRLDGHRH